MCCELALNKKNCAHKNLCTDIWDIPLEFWEITQFYSENENMDSLHLISPQIKLMVT